VETAADCRGTKAAGLKAEAEATKKAAAAAENFMVVSCLSEDRRMEASIHSRWMEDGTHTFVYYVDYYRMQDN
jgi:hypothetical protein